MPNPARLVLLALLLLGSLPAAEEPWARLKVGMRAADTITLLGHPIFHRQGHGFMTWTYDHGAEVLLHANGTVMGWTAPVAARLPCRSRDIWSDRPAGEFPGTMHSVLPRPLKPGIKSVAAGASRRGGNSSYEDLIRG